VKFSYLPTLTLSVVAALLTGCSKGGADLTTGGGTGSSPASVPGATVAGPSAPAFRSFLQDPNQRGTAASLHLSETRWGRLVQVFDYDAATQLRQLVHADFLVGASVASDGVDYELVENFAGQSELTILHKRGTGGFKSALLAAEGSTVPVGDPPMPPWSMLPRNAAISLRFDDLLDAATVDGSTIRIQTGVPAQVPFEARLFADSNYGSVADPEGDGSYSFYPTRVIADLAVSELEALSSPQPLTVNNVGLPASSQTQNMNVELRVPTTVAPQLGQLIVLTNASGNALDLVGNGSIDLSTPTQDVLRRFRSGGPSVLTGDPFNGFLQDVEAPQMVAELSLAITGAIQADSQVAGGYRLSSAAFNTAACAAVPEVGDALRQGGMIAIVYGTGTLNGAVVTDLDVRVVVGGAPQTGLAELWTSFDPVLSNEQCFVHYLPQPILAPNRGVNPTAQLHVRFSEPMDASSVDPFDSFTVSTTSGTPDAMSTVVAEISPRADLARFDFIPSMPLSHQAGNNETYHVRVGTNAVPTDLAGNPLAAPLRTAEFQLDPGAPTQLSGNLALRFDSPDMVGNDGFYEFRGQHLFDLVNEQLLPRPITHFDVAADRNQPVPSVMTPFAPGIQTPLSPLGSKLHQLWRYADLGMSLLDETNTNVDVESLSWAPVGGQVVADQYPEFSIQLGHANVLPDEFLNPQSGFPKWPLSGLGATYASNYATAPELVHDRSLGYVVNPANLYQASSGTTMLPYPLNGGVAPDDKRYYTWRDTGVLAQGGDLGNGAPFDQEIAVLGLPSNKAYTAGQVPSIGLPLLMEFRCYPTQFALGLNAFDISIAANSSARPNFRAHSTGGINSSGNPVLIDPDQADVATGGFAPPLGQSTLPVDNAFYIGELGLVTRVSRVHSIWFDAGALTVGFATPTMLGDLPAGTQVELAYRGATSIQGGVTGNPGYIAEDAAGLDPYGDSLVPLLNGAPLYLNGVSSWTDDIHQIVGARYFQVRVTFVGNAATNETASLSGLGFAWTD
jgi:Bacterial Ig-like domain